MFIPVRKAALIGLAAAFATFALPAFAADVTVRHAQGETTLAEKPAKIVVFDLAVLDTLHALGVPGVVGVPNGNKPDYLADYAGGKVPEVGTFFEPDYEAVAAAEPDLIIVAARSAAKYADLSKIAPTIDLTIDANRFLASAEENVRSLARLFGKEKEAETLLGRIEAATAAVREKAPSAGRTLFVLTTGGKVGVYGAGSRFGMLYSDFGFTEADSGITPGGHGQPVSFEYILEKNPDTLIVLDRDAAIGQAKSEAAEKLLDNEIVRQTTAWKEGRVIYVNGVLWYLAPGGLTSMQKVVDELGAALARG